MIQAIFGWLNQSVHRWSTSMMVLHVFCIYLKKHRELTWVIDVILDVLIVSFDVTRYSLPWDQIGYWAVKYVTGIPEDSPIIGLY